MKQILLLLLTTFSLSAQVKGVVLDSISGKPIPYVGIFTSKPELNFSADEKGKFKAENLSRQDSLWFFTTGYEEKKIAVKNFDKKILLKPLLNKGENEKENVELLYKKKQWIDFQKTNNSFKTISSSSTNLTAYFFEGINSDKKSLINSLSFNLVNLTPKTNILKIRFFKADSIKHIREEILSKSIIISIKTSEKRELNNIYHTRNLQEIDLSNEQIEIPKEGFFIAIELLNIKQNQFNNIIDEENSTLISPSINITNIETKVYQYIKGKWKKAEKINSYPDFKISISQQEN